MLPCLSVVEPPVRRERQGPQVQAEVRALTAPADLQVKTERAEAGGRAAVRVQAAVRVLAAVRVQAAVLVRQVQQEQVAVRVRQAQAVQQVQAAVRAQAVQAVPDSRRFRPLRCQGCFCRTELRTGP